MEKLNSALLAGEIPFLFTNDEMEGLLQSLQVNFKKMQLAMRQCGNATLSTIAILKDLLAKATLS